MSLQIFHSSPALFLSFFRSFSFFFEERGGRYIASSTGAWG